jgi:zinc finger protein-like protein
LKVVFTWIDGETVKKWYRALLIAIQKEVMVVWMPPLMTRGEHICSDEEYKVGSRNCAKSDNGQAERHPIDDILH